MRIATACLLISPLAGCAQANVHEPVSRAAIEISAPDTRLSLQAPTTAPFAYTHFCLRYADECRVHEAQDSGFDAFQGFSIAHWDELVAVNDEINNSIVPHADRTRIGFDAWRIAPPSGDCNDFAVTKRHELLARGWSSRSLLLAEVVTRQGVHHLVLVVRSDRKDVVLDNLTSTIREWSQAPYDWVRVQSPDDPETWFTVLSA